MTEASPQSSLSSTYWELHRNTLLFSALLLIICIPGAKPATTQSFLWLSFSDVAFNSLRFIAFCAATYAFITYILEWFSEPYQLLRRENRLAVSSRERLDNLALTASTGIEAALARFRNVTEQTETFASPHYSEQHTYDLPEIDEVVQRCFDNVAGNALLRSPMPQFRYNVKTRFGVDGPLTPDQIIALAEPTIEAVAKGVAKSTGYVISHRGATRLRLALEEANRSADAVRDELGKLAANGTSLRSLKLSMSFALFRWRAKSFSRIVVVGLIVPVTVYATALAHFGGQLGIAHVWSVFAVAPKAPSSKPASKPALAPASTKG